MMRLVAVLGAMLGCGSLQPSATKQVFSGETETLFNKLIATAPEQQIPQPFAKLVSFLGQYGKPIGVLIPLGRSLQRKAGYPDAFKDPRRLVGFAELDAVDGMAEFDIAGRLFLGYVEKTGTIEVLSILPGEKEFAFQIVEDYHHTGLPAVKSPDRSVCTSCHQHGGPIFSVFPWEETNSDIRVAALLDQHHPDGFVDGIRIGHGFDIPNPSHDPADKFEVLVTEATLNMRDTEIWQEKCKEVECRKALIRNTFAANALSPAMQEDTVVSVSSLDELISVSHLFNETQRTAHINALQNYSIADTVRGVVASISMTEDLQPFAQLTMKEKGALHVIDFIREMIARTAGEEFTPLQTLPVLTATEVDALKNEMEKILIHIHSQDLHVNTIFDPLTKRRTNTDVETLATISKVLQKTKHLFRRQTMLSGNTYDVTADGIVKLGVDKDFSRLLYITTDLKLSELSPLRVLFQAKEHSHVSCQQGHCEFSNLWASNSRDMFTEVNFSFSGDTELEKKPRNVSKLSFKVGNNAYGVNLLCRNVNHTKGYHYECSAYDLWQIDAAVVALFAEHKSSVHAELLSPVAIVKEVLANLGHTLKTHRGKIDWRQNVNVADDSVSACHYQLDAGDAVSNTLLVHCSGCHATDISYPPPFLCAEDHIAFCRKIADYRDSMIRALAEERMPPAGMSTIVRHVLVAGLRAETGFCVSP